MMNDLIGGQDDACLDDDVMVDLNDVGMTR
jgi:hypothetical protein